MYPKNTFHDIKRLIGRKYDDSYVQADKKLWAFDVQSDANNKPILPVTYKNEDKTVIDLNEINTVIQFKNEECKLKHFNEFQSNIKELVDLESIEIDDALIADLYDSDEAIVETLEN
jgi:hypothetical protein